MIVRVYYPLKKKKGRKIGTWTFVLPGELDSKEITWWPIWNTNITMKEFHKERTESDENRYKIRVIG